LKILQVSAYDLMGEQFNGLALHRAMTGLGIESSMLVHDRFGQDPGVGTMAGPVLGQLNRIAQPIEDLLSLHSVIDVAGFGLFRSPQYRSADVVHLQLMHGRRFFSLLHLPRLAREKPVAWTIHDPWLTTGHCVHPLACGRWRGGCGQCPDLGRDFQMRRDRTALNWRIKRDALAKAPMTLVFASRWMQQQAAASPILGHLPYEIIPFGVDPAVFHPGRKEAAREALGIPEDADVIAFRASERPQAFKGTGYLVQALTAYRPRRKTYLLTFEQVGGLSALRERFPLIEHGWVGDRESVVRALQAADLFLMPSTAESFGMMAVESMACGVPVVCFEGTALPDVIGAPRSGVAVAYGDHGALLRAIEELMGNREGRVAMGAEALKLVLREYTMCRYVERHLALYERLARQGAAGAS
jgi:glycosyltransferase involved in cell wall biosynthesis